MIGNISIGQTKSQVKKVMGKGPEERDEMETQKHGIILLSIPLKPSPLLHSRMALYQG